MFPLALPFPRPTAVSSAVARVGRIERAIFEAFPVESVRNVVARCRAGDALSFLGF